jgi:phosphatidylinositol-3-phosphatase
MRTRVLALAAVAALLSGVLAAVSLNAPARAAGARTAVAPASEPCGRLSAPPDYQHVVWIWMENHTYSSIIGSSEAPYLNSIAAKCGLATNYHNVTRPSLPNYIAATSGLGYRGLEKFMPNCNPRPGCRRTSATSIFDQGRTWKAYQESMPSNCYRKNAGLYVVRHNPPPYYTGLAECAQRDLPYFRLAIDLATHHMPAFAFITPNLVNDMHDGTVADGDRWLSRNLPTILNSDQYRHGTMAVFITWDEGGGRSTDKCATNTTDAGCHVATFVISPSTVPGTWSGELFNHYSLLGTAERLLHLPLLGRAADFPTMISAFRL